MTEYGEALFDRSKQFCGHLDVAKEYFLGAYGEAAHDYEHVAVYSKSDGAYYENIDKDKPGYFTVMDAEVKLAENGSNHWTSVRTATDEAAAAKAAFGSVRYFVWSNRMRGTGVVVDGIPELVAGGGWWVNKTVGGIFHPLMHNPRNLPNNTHLSGGRRKTKHRLRRRKIKTKRRKRNRRGHSRNR